MGVGIYRNSKDGGILYLRRWLSYPSSAADSSFLRMQTLGSCMMKVTCIDFSGSVFSLTRPQQLWAEVKAFTLFQFLYFK